MAVTIGTYGATGAAGWTVVTATEPSGEGSGFSGVGTRKIYVDSAAADDTGDGSQANPKKTLGAGLFLIRNGSPDWLLFKKGGVWTDQAFGLMSNKSGLSADAPFFVSSYGTGARPLIKPGKLNNLAVGCQASDTHVNYFAITGIEFYAYTRDPDNPSYDVTTGETAGFRVINSPRFWLIEDCKFTFFNNNTLQGSSAVNTIGKTTVRRNVICDNYDADGSHAQGIYCESNADLRIEENVFDHNGWNESVGNRPDIFKHNIYIQSLQNPCAIRGNITARASANGLQQRPGGTCYDNLFLNNPIAGFVAATASDMNWNVVLQGTDIQSSPITARGMGLQINTDANGSTAKFNIVAHQESANPSGSAFALSVVGGITGAVLTDNIAYDWASSAGEIIDSGTGTTKSNNVIDGVGYPAPTRSVATYNALQGGTATLAAFLTECRLQSKDNWRPAYTARAVNDYIRAGFGMRRLAETITFRLNPS